MGYIKCLPSCLYCSVTSEDTWLSTEFVVALPHPTPLATCHLVIAPRRHVSAFYDLDVQEQRMMWDALAQLRQRIGASIAVEGFDAGFVDAPTGAGQEFHAYLHLVPRIPGQRVTLPHDVEWVDLGSQA